MIGELLQFTLGDSIKLAFLHFPHLQNKDSGAGHWCLVCVCVCKKKRLRKQPKKVTMDLAVQIFLNVKSVINCNHCYITKISGQFNCSFHHCRYSCTCSVKRLCFCNPSIHFCSFIPVWVAVGEGGAIPATAERQGVPLII